MSVDVDLSLATTLVKPSPIQQAQWKSIKPHKISQIVPCGTKEDRKKKT